MTVQAIDLQVDDVPDELDAGGLRDWGIEAAYLRGPGHLIVDVCRDV